MFLRVLEIKSQGQGPISGEVEDGRRDESQKRGQREEERGSAHPSSELSPWLLTLTHCDYQNHHSTVALFPRAKSGDHTFQRSLPCGMMDVGHTENSNQSFALP